MTENISIQAIGAFGEKAVEAELLRYKWIPANVNHTVKNAARFDIYAVKGDRSVQIRVKTCGPDRPVFLFGGFRPGEPITANGISDADFTIVVRMGALRKDDKFYIVPTTVVREEIRKRQKQQKDRNVKENRNAKDIGMWRLSFSERKDGNPEAGRGIEKKWSRYLDDWGSLDGK